MNYFFKIVSLITSLTILCGHVSASTDRVDFSCSATKGSTQIDFNFSKKGQKISFKSTSSSLASTYDSAKVGVEPAKNQSIKASSRSMENFNFSWRKGLPSLDWQDKLLVIFKLTLNNEKLKLNVISPSTVTFGESATTLNSGDFFGSCSSSKTQNTSSEVSENTSSESSEKSIRNLVIDVDGQGGVQCNNWTYSKFGSDGNYSATLRIKKIFESKPSVSGYMTINSSPLLVDYGDNKKGESWHQGKRWTVEGVLKDNGDINLNVKLGDQKSHALLTEVRGNIDKKLTAISKRQTCIFWKNARLTSDKKVIKQPRNVSIKQAFNDFDANGRINIQKALTDLKFYRSSIDGSYGPGTDKAIEKYLLDTKAPLETKKEVISALKKLIAEQVQSDELAVVRSELSAKDALFGAQLIINDVEEFLKSGSGSFDLEFAKKYSAIRKVNKGQWNSTLESKFADFKSYVFANEDFQKYAEDQKNKREAEFNAILENNREQLTDLTESLKTWLQTNLIHEKANDVYDQVAAGEETLEGNDLQKIQQTIIKAGKLANALDLTQETLSVDVTQKAEMKINEAAYNSFDATGKMGIQKALTDLGLFKLAIDGVFGPGTNIAITEYLKTKGITEITNSDAVLEQLKTLVATTLESNALAVVRSEMSAEEEYLAAVVVMQDIETFLSEKIGSFGLEFIRKYGPARGVSKGFWSAEKRARFLALKEYVFANEDFRNYANNQKAEREQALLTEISSAKEKLTEHLGLLRLWLEANLIDERAEEIFETVSDIEKALEGKALNNLLKILEVTTRTVKDLNLINSVTTTVKTDSKYELDAIYMYVNLSGFADNVFKNLEGLLELEDGYANICQIGDIDDWDQFAAYQKLTKLVDIENSMLKFNCSQSEDFYIVAGTSLASGTLPSIVAITDLSDLYLLRKDEIVDLKRRFQYKSEANYEDVLAGVKQGYGLFYIAGHPPVICSSEDGNIDAHLQLINEKQDIIRYFAPQVDNIDFDISLPTINKRLQKKTCGMVYGSAQDLKILANASIKANNYEVEFLPIWFSEQKVNEAIQVQKNLQALDNSKEQDAEQQRILQEEKLKKLKESAENRQRELRVANEIKFTSIIDRLSVGIRAVTSNIFEDQNDEDEDPNDYELNEELVELIEPIQFDLLDKKLEGWEPVSTMIKKVDFGTVIFNERRPEAIVVDLEINMKNRKIGKFEPYCTRVHIVYDLDFDMWRREMFSECDAVNKTNYWQLKNDFESGWVVTVE